MGVIAEEPDIFDYYRRGAYREMLHVVRAKKPLHNSGPLLDRISVFSIKRVCPKPAVHRFCD